MIPKKWKFPIKMESFHFTRGTFSLSNNHTCTFRQTLPTLSAKHYHPLPPNHHIPLYLTNYLRLRPGSNHQPLDPSPSALTTRPPGLSYITIENHTIWLDHIIYDSKSGILNPVPMRFQFWNQRDGKDNLCVWSSTVDSNYIPNLVSDGQKVSSVFISADSKIRIMTPEWYDLWNHDSNDIPILILEGQKV